ncbi:MAG: rRNA maturation RNAse YbeY, partial [Clostridia bacterium]|nr:rRNA maturation RNAse YbeY [Clostridia bacterium]
MAKVKVVITNDQKTVKVPKGLRLLIRRCCHAVLELEGFSGSAEVDVSLVDNERIHAINLEQRQIDS